MITPQGTGYSKPFSPLRFITLEITFTETINIVYHILRWNNIFNLVFFVLIFKYLHITRLQYLVLTVISPTIIFQFFTPPKKKFQLFHSLPHIPIITKVHHCTPKSSCRQQRQWGIVCGLWPHHQGSWPPGNHGVTAPPHTHKKMPATATPKDCPVGVNPPMSSPATTMVSRQLIAPPLPRPPLFSPWIWWCWCEKVAIEDKSTVFLL